MPPNQLRASSGPWLLLHPAVRSECSHCHPVMGVVLDQRGRGPSAGVPRPADRSDNGEPQHRHQRQPPAGVLHQGRRRLDVFMSPFCLRCTLRIRLRQRGIEAQGHRQGLSSGTFLHRPTTHSSTPLTRPPMETLQ